MMPADQRSQSDPIESASYPARCALESSEPNLESPFFLVGAERSGSTLLRLMLDHHPRIACHFEFEFAVDLVGDDGELPAIEIAHNYFRNHRIFLHSGSVIDPQLSYPELVRSFLRQKASGPNVRHVGATVHRHFDRLRQLWPEARYIYLLRDGRDVARSVVNMGWEGNPYAAADRWIAAESTWARLRPLLREDLATEVRYESLVANPTDTLTRLCGFLGLDYDPAMLQYAHGTTYEVPDPQFAEQWRRSMPVASLRRLEGRLGPRLTARGYQLSGHPPVPTSPLGNAWLRLHSRWGRFAFRRRRYGLPLVLADAVARRLGAAHWQRHLQRRLNAIDSRLVR